MCSQWKCLPVHHFWPDSWIPLRMSICPPKSVHHPLSPEGGKVHLSLQYPRLLLVWISVHCGIVYLVRLSHAVMHQMSHSKGFLLKNRWNTRYRWDAIASITDDISFLSSCHFVIRLWGHSALFPHPRVIRGMEKHLCQKQDLQCNF